MERSVIFGFLSPHNLVKTATIEILLKSASIIMPPVLEIVTSPNAHRSFDMGQNDSTFEVDHERNVTALYESISNSDWESALQALKANEYEARTWVVRYHEDESKGIMWRFLPIHSACARQPPVELVSALIRAYPQGAGSCDDQGMYPLHYAAGNQASTEVIKSLLFSYPPAAGLADPQGLFPIHYMAQWGPSEPDAIGIIVFADREVCKLRDDNGCIWF